MSVKDRFNTECNICEVSLRRRQFARTAVE